jgi:hypothetical protein
MAQRFASVVHDRRPQAAAVPSGQEGDFDRSIYILPDPSSGAATPSVPRPRLDSVASTDSWSFAGSSSGTSVGSLSPLPLTDDEASASRHSRIQRDARWTAPLPLNPTPPSALRLSLRDAPWMSHPSFRAQNPSEISLSDAASAATTALEQTPTQTRWRLLSFLARLLGIDDDTLALLTSSELDDSSNEARQEEVENQNQATGRLLCSEANDARGGRLRDGIRVFAGQDT